MPRGGRRPGAERKTNAQIQSVRELLDETVTWDQWQELINNLVRQARRGSVRAAQLLLSYRFGSPNAEHTADRMPEPISIIKVHHAPPRYPPLPEDSMDYHSNILK